MSTVGSTTTDVHYSIDGNQNYSIKSEESLSAATKNDRLPVDPLQFGHGAAATRKGSFVITDILQHDDEELDDTDSTLHSSLWADQPVAHEVAETPKRTRSSDDSLSWVSPPVVDNVSPTDSSSRFRIVKIESRDRWHRGRWTCHDFADPPEHVETEQMAENDSGTSSMSRSGPPIYYIPGAQDALKSPFGIVYSTGGHPILEANLLPASPRYARGPRFFSDILPTSTQSDVTGMQFSSQRISAVNQSELLGHSAARRLLFNKCVPLRVSVSESLESDIEDSKVNGSFLSRQISSSLLISADAAQKLAVQTPSPLNIMMSATLGSSSEPDLRLDIVCLLVSVLLNNNRYALKPAVFAKPGYISFHGQR